MAGEARVNVNGYPYTLPEVVEVDDQILLSFQVWSFVHGELVEKSAAVLEGLPIKERRIKAQGLAQKMAAMLHDGHTEGDPGDMSLLAGIKLGARKRIMVMGSRGTERYRSFINVFSEWVSSTGRKNKPLSEMSRRDVFAFLDWTMESRGVGRRTRNNYLENVRGSLTELCNRELIPTNPAEGIKRFTTQPTKYPFFNRPQQIQLEAYLKKEMPHLYRFTRFIYHGFLRPAEIKRLKVQDIDLKIGVIMTWTHITKNKKQEPVMINPGLLRTIKEMQLDDVPGNWYLFGQNWEPSPTPCRSRNKFGNAHRKALEEIGLYDGILNMYTWKNTGVCRAFDAGVNVIQIKNQCRHASLDMTYEYMRVMAKILPTELREVDW